MSENVVDFKGRQEEKEAQKKVVESEEKGIELPAAVVEKLEKYDEWVDEFTKAVDDAVIAFAKESEEKRDISLPLEALARAIGRTSSELDMQIPDDKEVEAHLKVRADLANEINKTVTSFMNINSTPIYQQDIYIAMTYVLVSYLQQHRMFTFVQDHMKGDGDHETSEDQSPRE